MKKIFLTAIALVTLSSCSAQKATTPEEAAKKLAPAIKAFESCMTAGDADACITQLCKNAKNTSEKYVIANLLFGIDTARSFRLHKEVALEMPSNNRSGFEYAIELHRRGAFKEAVALYEAYSKAAPEDYQPYVWLADCYINMGDAERSIANWKKANHAKNHTGIDFAIGTIYGRTDQVMQRSAYRKEINKGNAQAAYALIFQDMNWETDWWNTSVMKEFLAEDMKLVKAKVKAKDYRSLNTYITVKNLSQRENNADSIRMVLNRDHLMPGKDTLPVNGQITSDILRICFLNKLVSEGDFFRKHGTELFSLAYARKDKELLNIYAYLQAVANGKVEEAIDKAGWKEFKDERFAISYFMGKGENNRYDDPELTQALADFPNSSKLYWVKTNCAKIEHKDLKPHLIELIRREFRSLNSDEGRFSYQLQSYYSYLEAEK